MSRYVFKLPDLGEGTVEAEIVGWRVKPGDVVAEDQALADVMTDKATVEIPSPVAGQVVGLGGEVGQVLAVGAELIRIERDGASALAPPPVAAAPPAPPAVPVPPASVAATPVQPQREPARLQPQRQPDDRTPLPNPLGFARAFREQTRTLGGESEPCAGAGGDPAVEPRMDLPPVRRHRRSPDDGESRPGVLTLCRPG